MCANYSAGHGCTGIRQKIAQRVQNFDQNKGGMPQTRHDERGTSWQTWVNVEILDGYKIKHLFGTRTPKKFEEKAVRALVGPLFHTFPMNQQTSLCSKLCATNQHAQACEEGARKTMEKTKKQKNLRERTRSRVSLKQIIL